MIIYTWKLAWPFFCQVSRRLVSAHRTWTWYGFHCCWLPVAHHRFHILLLGDYHCLALHVRGEELRPGLNFPVFLSAASHSCLHLLERGHSPCPWPSPVAESFCHLVVTYGWGRWSSQLSGSNVSIGEAPRSPSYGSSNLLCIWIGLEWYFPILPPVVKHLPRYQCRILGPKTVFCSYFRGKGSFLLPFPKKQLACVLGTRGFLPPEAEGFCF